MRMTERWYDQKTGQQNSQASDDRFNSATDDNERRGLGPSRFLRGFRPPSGPGASPPDRNIYVTCHTLFRYLIVELWYLSPAVWSQMLWNFKTRPLLYLCDWGISPHNAPMSRQGMHLNISINYLSLSFCKDYLVIFNSNFSNRGKVPT